MWISASAGDTGVAEEFADKIEELADASIKLNLPSLAHVFHTIDAILKDSASASSNEHLALEMASGLLFAENALEQVRQLPADFGQKAEILARRLISVQSGVAPSDSDPMLSMPQEAQQQHTVMKLAAEMGANLRQVERILDEYFADLAQFDILADVDPILHQIAGGLSLLEQEDARRAVMHIQRVLSELHEDGGAAPSRPASQETLQDIAHNISALGFFLEMLGQRPDSAKNRFSFDSKSGLFRSRLVDVPDVRNAVFMYSETDPNAVRNELEEILGHDTALLGRERANVADPIESAPATEDATVDSERAARSTGFGAAQQTDSSGSFSSDESGDDELLEIFTTEADETLEYVRNAVAEVRGNPKDQDQFPTLRRSFHTLKGSSRMVGLTAFSEASASVEQVMNLWLAEARDGTPGLYALLEKAAEELGKWVDELKASGVSLRTPASLVEAAERVKKGGEFYFVEETLVDASTLEQQEEAEPAIARQDENPNDGSAMEKEDEFAALAALEKKAEGVSEPDSSEQEQAQSNVIDFPAAAPVTMHDDNIKYIGNLEISLPLFNIYMAEADELIRILSQDFAEWWHEPERPVTDKAIHSAHSLAGCSATVGFQPLREIAHALEMFLQGLENRRLIMTVDEFAILQQCIDCLKQMLSQVGLNEMPQSHPELVTQLNQAQQALSRHSAVEYAQEEIEDGQAENAPLFTEAEETRESIGKEERIEPESDHPLAPKDTLDPDLLPVFLEEGRDLLPQIGQALRAWQKTPSDFSIAPRILRHLHTAKGSARMAGAMGLGQHIHMLESRIENVLRSKAVNPQVLDDLMTRHDHGMQLFSLLQESAENMTSAFGTPMPSGSPEDVDPSRETGQTNNAPTGGAAAIQRVRVRADILDRLVNQAGEVSIARSKIENEIDTLRQSMFDLTDNLSRLRLQLREVEIQAETQIASRLAQTSDREFDPLEFDRFSRLQELTRMMTESVDDISTIQEGLVRTVDGATIDLENQNRLTRGLQEDLMQVRMVPFSSIAERLYQVTRQTAKETDKRVNLDINGASVEIDRGVLEKMMGPLEHLLRNAIVHGIESRDQRKEAGKNETGELLVEIRQAGNEVVLQFADDGQGLNVERIRAGAESAGLLAPGRDMSEAQLKELIFHPGFSTASEITELAGRGVGLDVVRAEVAALGGRVAIDSNVGSGTRFTINLPLTLAVTSVVLLSTGGTVYAVPSILVEQVQHFKNNALADAYNTGEVTWQGERMPLHFLSALLGDVRATPVAQQYSPVVILRSGNDRVAIHVDEILGNKEVVVKNVGPQLARMIGIAGATVLGSGNIVLILNPIPLAQRAANAVTIAASTETLADLDQLPAVVADATVPDGTQQPAMTGGADSSQAQGLRKKNIVMVVDDSLTVRRVTQRFLTREGYQVVLAKDGIDALEQLQNVTPDIMLVDIEMPRMDGFDLTRNVRSDSRLRNVPIIMITSRSASRHRNYAMDLGVNEYFGKPFQEEELLKSIDTFVHTETTVV
jgi:chemosensory pili system protein ChpA (sensor histidine kinase/response regulator)